MLNIKFEFEATIHELRLGEFSGIENFDVLDEDDDGVQVCGMIENNDEFDLFKQIFTPNDDMIQNIYIEHKYKSIFESMDCSENDDENFAIAIENDDDLETFIKLIEAN